MEKQNGPEVKPEEDISNTQAPGSKITSTQNGKISLLLHGLGLAITALIAQFALFPNRGLDLTDEGLYLAALYGPPTHTWGFPFSWHLHPISNLVGENISDLRFVFSWIALLVFYLFGFSLGVFLQKRFSGHALFSFRNSPFLFAFMAVIFGLTFFDLMLNRLPSYNWVNIVGLLVSISGLFLLFARKTQFGGIKSQLVRVSLLFMVSFGAFYSLPGKPSSILFIAAGLVLGSLIFLGLRRALEDFLIFLVSCLLIGTLSIFGGVWPSNFVEVLGPAFSLVDLTPGRSVFSSLVFELTYITVIYEEASLVSALAFPALAFSYLVLLALIGFGNKKIILATFTAATSVQILVTGPLRRVLFDYGLLEAGVPNSLTAWIYFSMVTVLIVRIFINSEYDVRENWKVLFFLFFIFSAGIFSYGFGSGMGVFGKTSDGAVFLFIGTLALLSFLAVDRFGKTLTAITATGLVMASLFSLGASVLEPYRGQSTLAQTEKIILNRGGEMLLDAQRKEEVERFAQMVAGIQISGDETVIPLTWRWASTLPVVSGLPSFPTLMPTIFGYEGSLGVLEKTLGRSWELGFGGEGNYYLITDQLTNLEPDQVEEIEQAISLTVESIEENIGKDLNIELIDFAPYTIWKVTLD